MRTVAMCFSLLPLPKYKFQTLASSWLENFHKLGRMGGKSSRLSTLSSNANGTRRYVRKTMTRKTEGKREITLSSKSGVVRPEAENVITSSSSQLHTDKLETAKFERNKDCGIQQKVTDNKDLAKLMTLIVFDIETTGFSRQNERIIEIALQDLAGGENSTFETLVNPECYVPNTRIHGISTHMVSRPDVPRMKELIPILLEYIRSRQKPGGQVLWIGHNARAFDVPFLKKEFSRCSIDIPENWLFMDTVPLARELIKSGGSDLPSKITLQALREYYKIPLVGSAHRAMSDVYALSKILQRMTFDLKVPISGLVNRSFRASEINIVKKTTKKKSLR